MKERLISGVNPYDDAYLFDHLIVGEMFSPGKVTLTGHDYAENWTTASAPDGSGETATHKGRAIQPFQATFDLCVDGDDEEGQNDFQQWETFQELLMSSTSTSPPTALFIYHPDLASNQITSVVLVSIGGMIRTDDPGRATVQVTLRPYQPEVSKKQSTAGTGAAAQPPPAPGAPEPEPDPNAAAKEELNALLDEAGAP